MKQLLVIAGLLSVVGFAKPYQLNCTAKNQPVGKQWLVTAQLTGTVDRGTKVATLQELEGTLSISLKNEKEPWSETSLHKRSVESDDYYHPVKYKNHYRFELHFEKNDSYAAEKVDFLLPKLFEVDRANRAYFILNHVNDTFGGTIALRCNVSENDPEPISR
ncbi:hypothetical protein EBR78_05010 [bacterium]|nr:hypothetical protein [bacterium]